MKKHHAAAVSLFLAAWTGVTAAKEAFAGPAEEIPALKAELNDLRAEIVQALAEAVEAKDPYAGGHMERARKLAGITAKKMKMPEKEIPDVEYAALLHDVGKITIDKSILLKPGRLTEPEFAEIKKHPEESHRILSRISFLKKAAEILLYHHERFDGKGYPRGLKGKEIPLGARIVFVLDAWDAMTSDRPYRRALSRETALGELKKGAGTQFDPEVVETFLGIEGLQ